MTSEIDTGKLVAVNGKAMVPLFGIFVPLQSTLHDRRRAANMNRHRHGRGLATGLINSRSGNEMISKSKLTLHRTFL